MKKKFYWELPEGYRLHLNLKLAEDRQSLIILTMAQLAVIALLVAAGTMRTEFSSAFDLPFGQIAAGLGAMSFGLVVYILAHEWAHGMAIRFITGRQAEFGFELKKGMAYASSTAYFGKAAYIFIALAPVVIWGVILWILGRDVDDHWFWYLYAVQIFNFSGAVGDFYVTWLTLKAPAGTIIRDYGTSMMFYAPAEHELQ